MRRPLKMRLPALVGVALSLSAPLVASADGNSVASSLGVYVFPAANQATEQQVQDEAACYQWATGQTGFDPQAAAQQQATNPPPTQTEQPPPGKDATRGAGVKGAARGAAAGAVVGEIANDDASEGAAYGAAAGAVSGRRQARKSQAQAQSQATAQAEQAEASTAEQLSGFRKAFGACPEGKKYTAKF